MENTKKINRELAFEKKQLIRLEKYRSKPKTKLYFITIVILILLVDILDNFTTNTPGNITSCFINEFFVVNKGVSYTDGLATHNLVCLITYAIGLITPFYKALGDKYGRKPLFVISTLGMTFGLFTIFLCKTYLVFIIGTCITTFFLGHDIQILYILEEAPAKHRAKIYSLVKCLGGLSSLMIPLLRQTMMHDDSSLWRNVYLLPAISGIFIAILVILFAKETEVFVQERYDYLQIPYEERQRIKKEEKEKAKESGIGPAIKYIFKHKALRDLLIIKCIFDIAILAVQNYNSIMANDFLFTEANISKAEYFFPIFYCLSVIVSGILADKIGRKVTILIFSSITLITFILFIVFCSKQMDPVVVGIMYGLYLGGYWIGRDYMEIMATEMVPTEIRSSIIGAFSLLVYSGMAIGYAANTVLIAVLAKVWLPSLIITVPAVTVAIILLLIKVKETKGVDYSEIKDNL